MLLLLPPEIFAIILEYCDIYDLRELRLVSGDILLMIKEFMPFSKALTEHKYNTKFLCQNEEPNTTCDIHFIERKHKGIVWGKQSKTDKDNSLYSISYYENGLIHGIEKYNFVLLRKNKIFLCDTVISVYNMGTLISHKSPKKKQKMYFNKLETTIITSSRYKTYQASLLRNLSHNEFLFIYWYKHSLNVISHDVKLEVNLKKRICDSICYDGLIVSKEITKRENGKFGTRVCLINGRIYIDIWIAHIHSYIQLSAKLTKKSIIKNFFRQ